MEFELQEYTPKQMDNLKAYQYTVDMFREQANVPGVCYTFEGLPYVFNNYGIHYVHAGDWVVQNKLGEAVQAWYVMSDKDFRAWYE